MKTTALIPLMVLATAMACAADLKFETRTVELKATPSDEELEAQFSFKNTGDSDVEITELDISCSCLLASTDKKVYAPGDSGKLDVIFKLGSFTGYQKKGLTVVTKDKRTRVEVGVQIPNVVTITPEIAEWQIGEDPAPKSFKFVVEHPDPIRITEVVCKRDEFTHELKTIKEGREYEIVLTPKSTETPLLGMLRISTDCKIPKHQKQMAFFAISRKKPAPAGGAGKGS
ncbi:MAG: DUF1573 domain-containing protein [Verrucomicrobiales bacterium]